MHRLRVCACISNVRSGLHKNGWNGVTNSAPALSNTSHPMACERCSGRNSHPGLIEDALQKQINDDKNEAQKGIAALTEKKKQAKAAKAQAESAKRVAAVERAIAAQDALDDTPQLKPGRKKAVPPRRVVLQSEESEAPSPRPSTAMDTEDTEASQGEDDTPKAKKSKKEKRTFRKVVEEVELTDTEDTIPHRTERPQRKGKGKEQPKPLPKAKPLVRTETLLEIYPQLDNTMDVSPELLFTPKPTNIGKRSKAVFEVSCKLSPSFLFGDDARTRMI